MMHRDLATASAIFGLVVGFFSLVILHTVIGNITSEDEGHK